MSYNNSINSGFTGLLTATTAGVISGIALTNHNILIGAANNSITSVAPSATSGIPLVSNGSSSDPSFTTAVVSGGGLGVTSTTAYGVMCAGTTSTGAVQFVTPGTSTYILQSGGASALPSYVNPAGITAGNLVLIQTQTASGVSSLAFTTGITSTYNNYILISSGYTLASTGVFFNLQLSTNGGSTYITTGYLTGAVQIAYTASSWGSNVNATTTLIYVNQTGSTNLQYPMLLNLYNITSGNHYPGSSMTIIGGNLVGSTGQYRISSGSYPTVSTVVNAFKIFPTSGNFTGKFSLYGIKET